MYLSNGSYFLVKKGKWKNLGKDYVEALLAYAKQTGGGDGSGIAKLIDKVLDYIEPKRAPNTMRHYRAAGERLKVMLAEFEPRQVLPRHVAEIKMHLADTPGVANRFITVLGTVFTHALEWGLVDSNPCVGIKRHKESKRGRYMTDDEMGRLLEHCNHRFGTIFLMCFMTGQRIGDVRTIQISDIAPDGIAFTQQKTSARLKVSLSPDLAELVERAKALPRKAGSDWLFCSRNGDKPILYETCREAFADAAAKAGLVDVRIHDLRAKSLTDAHKQGKNAQKLSGHTDAKMTERYIRAREIDIAEPPSMPSIRQIPPT